MYKPQERLLRPKREGKAEGDLKYWNYYCIINISSSPPSFPSTFNVRIHTLCSPFPVMEGTSQHKNLLIHTVNVTRLNIREKKNNEKAPIDRSIEKNKKNKQIKKKM